VKYEREESFVGVLDKQYTYAFLTKTINDIINTTKDTYISCTT